MKRIFLLLCMLLLFKSLDAQVCGTPGKDGSSTGETPSFEPYINTYYAPKEGTVLPAGSRQIVLNRLSLGTSKNTTITPGDLLMIIQMQDATIHLSNDANYGANNPFSGPDGLGGTGYTDLGNSGKYEYVVATNVVLTTDYDALLTFRGAGAGRGTVNEYVSTPYIAGASKSFQVIRIPQYSNLKLNNDNNRINEPPLFYYQVGAILAFNVAGTLDLNGYNIDASKVSFIPYSGTFQDWKEDPRDTYSIAENYMELSDYKMPKKGGGVAGTPTHNFALGVRGKGAPANGGGAGNVNLAGGGGGGNAGAGGVGGNGIDYDDPRDTYPNGGRPGSPVYEAMNPDFTRLMSGGSGGYGDGDGSSIDNCIGGGIVLINTNRITGTGKILVNGDTSSYYGAATFTNGGGSGGGSGGAIFVNELHPDLPANITLEARGGNGRGVDKTAYIVSNPGPGGGGGGGQIFNSMTAARASTNVSKGKAGRVYDLGTTQGAADGQDGNVRNFTNNDLPPYLRYGNCFAGLVTTLSQSNTSAGYYPGSEVVYEIKTRNAQPGGAAGARVEVQLPSGFSFISATVVYGGDASGPEILTNLSSDTNRPLLGDFTLLEGDDITISLIARVACTAVPGTYHASAQALSFDPLRTENDPDRRVSAVVNAFSNTKTIYETTGDPVPGSNYDGLLASSTAEDVQVVAPDISNNEVQGPAATVCVPEDPELLHGSMPSGGVAPYGYQWQQSADGISFTDIVGAVAQDYDPPEQGSSVYYRRNVYMLGCTNLINTSNSVFVPSLKSVLDVRFDALAAVCQQAGEFTLTQGSELRGILAGNGVYSGKGVKAPGPGQTDYVFDPAVAGPGTHTLTYKFVTDQGCSSKPVTQDIIVYPSLVVDAGPDQAVLEGGEIRLVSKVIIPESGSSEPDLPVPVLHYKWTPSTGLNRDDIPDPIASPTKDMVYSLTVSTDQSCNSNTDEVVVRILNNPEIPNTFTPNGDGINDVWNIKYLQSYPKATIKVFNRYGQLVFSGGANTGSWDGRIGGKDVPVGTYYYILDPKNGRKKLTGPLTILR